MSNKRNSLMLFFVCMQNFHLALPQRKLLLLRFHTLVLLFCLFVSCSEREPYSRFYHIDGGLWYRDSVLSFDVDSLTHLYGTEFEVMLELTTNLSYSYRNLELQVSHKLGDSLVRADTIHCRIADDYGRWLGSSVGGLSQLSIPYPSSDPRGFVFPPVDSLTDYALTIRHLMSDDPLAGVEKVGVKFMEKSQ